MDPGRAHARSGDRVAIAAYLGGKDTFDRAIADYAIACADQNDRDYAALQAAVSAGGVTAAPAGSPPGPMSGRTRDPAHQ